MYCGLNCKQKAWRIRHAAQKARRRAFAVAAGKLAEAQDWAGLSAIYENVPDGFNPELTAAIRRLAELAAEAH